MSSSILAKIALGDEPSGGRQEHELYPVPHGAASRNGRMEQSGRSNSISSGFQDARMAGSKFIANIAP
jgi:hypothetical protein